VSLVRTRIPAASGGLDLDSAPAYVAGGHAVLLQNLLPGRAGKLIQRGPARASLAVSPSIGGGHWVNGDKVCMFSGSQMRVFTLQGSAISAAAAFTPNANVSGPKLPQRPSAVLGSSAYGIQQTYGYLVRWANAGAVAADFVPILNGPQTPQAIVTHLSRLFVVGGTAPGGSGGSFLDRLYWTDPNWNGTDTLASWQDDATGLVNTITLPDYANDPPVALVSTQKALLILRRNSVWTVTGSTPSAFVLAKRVDGGCLNPASVVQHNDNVYFLSQSGYVRYDGVSLQTVSDPIRPVLPPSTLDTSQNVAAAALQNDYIALNVGHPTSGLSRLFLYHVPTGAWTEVSPAVLGSTGEVILLGRSANYSYGSNGANLAILDTLPDPELAAFGVGNPPGRDWGGATPFTDGPVIAGTYTSPLVPLGTPSEKAQLHRLLADVVLKSSSAGVLATMTATDEPGTVLATVQVSPTTNAVRQRIVADAFGECDAVQVTWAVSGPAGSSVPVFEIHDTTVEYQTTRQRTG